MSIRWPAARRLDDREEFLAAYTREQLEELKPDIVASMKGLDALGVETMLNADVMKCGIFRRFALEFLKPKNTVRIPAPAMAPQWQTEI